MTNEPRIDERYISFEKIDCFENACLVIDNLIRITQNQQYNNLYWQKIIPTIPQSYYLRSREMDTKEELLYLVCSNVFYLEELFENADDELALSTLRRCELECC